MPEHVERKYRNEAWSSLKANWTIWLPVRSLVRAFVRCVVRCLGGAVRHAARCGVVWWVQYVVHGAVRCGACRRAA